MSVSTLGIHLSPIPSVCRSRKFIVANIADFIRMLFGVVSGISRGMGVLDRVVIVKGKGAVLGVNVGCPIVTNGHFVA